MLESKVTFIKYCQDHYVPLNFRPWWMDTVSGQDNWDVILSQREDNLEGYFIYQFRRRMGLRIIDMPRFTAYGGPMLLIPKNIKKSATRYSFENRVLSDLLSRVPRSHLYYQRWHPSITNHLSAMWSGLQQTTLYTYQLRLSNLDDLWTGLKSTVRKTINQIGSSLTMLETDDLSILYALMQKSFQIKGKSNPYDWQSFQRFDEACRKHEARKIFLVQDENRNPLAALYIVYDEQAAQFLVSGFDPVHKTRRAMPYAVWKVLEHLHALNIEIFDFEGSIYPEIEMFNRAFGGELIKHFKIYKTSSMLLDLVSRFRKSSYQSKSF